MVNFGQDDAIQKMKGDLADLKAATDKLFDAAEEDRSAPPLSFSRQPPRGALHQASCGEGSRNQSGYSNFS